MPILPASRSDPLHAVALLPCSSVGIVRKSAYDLVLAPYHERSEIAAKRDDP
jgi:hypothetical protein